MATFIHTMQEKVKFIPLHSALLIELFICFPDYQEVKHRTLSSCLSIFIMS